jgi:hypothetical protein
MPKFSPRYKIESKPDHLESGVVFFYREIGARDESEHFDSKHAARLALIAELRASGINPRNAIVG